MEGKENGRTAKKMSRKQRVGSMEWLQVDQDVLNTMQKNEDEGNRKELSVSPVP